MQIEPARRVRRPRTTGFAVLALVGLAWGGPAIAAPPEDPAARLVAAYPEHLSHGEAGEVVWRDGTRMRLDDGLGVKRFADWLARPDIADMLQQPYPGPPGAAITAPAREQDPGRARNKAFFDRMYGDCRSGKVAQSLVEIVWLPRIAPQTLKVTRINGVAGRLEAISRELEALPAALHAYLTPSAGSYVCRAVAGTQSPSAHGWGIAIDIAVARADYWRWAKPGPDGAAAWRNRIPAEIVAVFERHGFIWGGRWSHFDTMHFEYRPELLLPAR